jgi:hypothetical protein
MDGYVPSLPRPARGWYRINRSITTTTHTQPMRSKLFHNTVTISELFSMYWNVRPLITASHALFLTIPYCRALTRALVYCS